MLALLLQLQLTELKAPALDQRAYSAYDIAAAG
jgi:hypothetical protein